METKGFLTDNHTFKVINITTEAIHPQTSAIQVNSEIVAIVPVTTTNYNPPKNEPSKGYQWRTTKMNVWRYLMAASLPSSGYDFSKYTNQLMSPQGLALAGGILGLFLLQMFSGGKKGKLATSYWGGGQETKRAKKKAIKQVTSPKCDSASLYIGVHRYKGQKLPKGSGGTPMYVPDVQRGTAVIGAPGSGKSFSAINPMLYSAIDQGFGIVLYDFKYPSQAKIASYAKSKGYEVHVFAPGFPESEVCNPIDFLRDSSDAETARQLATVINKNFRMLGGGNIAIEVGKDTYNLVPDKSTPGAYKWEKVDLNQGIDRRDTVILMPDMYMDNVRYSIEFETHNEPSDYQAQTLAARIVQDVPDLGENSSSDYEPAIRITAYTELGKKTVIYEQDSEGKCRTNLITENLSQDEIMDVAYEPLIKLLPPSSDIVKNYQDTKNFLEKNENFQPETNVKSQRSDIESSQFDNISAAANDLLAEVLNNTKFKVNVTELIANTEKIQSGEFITVEDIPPDEETIDFVENINISNPPDFDDPPDEDEQITANAQNHQQVELTDNTILEPSNQIDNQPLNVENFESTLSTVAESAEDNFEELIINNLQEEVENQENYTSNEITVSNKKKPVESENPSVTPKKENLEEEEQYAAQYTYQQAANSEGVEPQAQQWARQVEVPVYEIKNKQAEKERYNGENKDIAQAATEMLKKYGTIEQDGSRIYRSDAFVIRQEGDTVSIHRRSDELQGWSNSLMKFKPGKGDKEPKITKQPTKMLGVERQEFLIISEHLQDKGKLPDLSSSDIRDVANSLGSLAPAGTIKTLEVFKQNEMLDTLNNILLTALKDELAVGEFTIKRTRDPEGKKASLQLFKTTEERGTQELVKFDLTKTEEGIKKEVAKMNISDYDINQVKFIAQNANKLNLEQVFEGGQTAQAQQPPNQGELRTQQAPQPQQIQSAGDIPVQVHPYIAQEWAEMTKKGSPAWGGAMNQGNEEILQKLKDNNGKLPIADQREMYLKIMTHKTNEAQKQGESTIEFTPLKDIMQDLQQWRAEEIKQQFTPTQVVRDYKKQKVAAAVPARKTVGGRVEL